MQLHLGAKWLYRIGFYVGFGALSLFILFVTAGFTADYLVANYLKLILIFVLALLVLGEIYARLAYNNFKYELTSKEVKIERGIIWKKYISIPYERVQNVEIHRGILARLIGFSTLAVHTAGYSGYATRYGNVNMPEGYLPAVSIQDAEKIRNFLIAKIGKKSGL